MLYVILVVLLALSAFFSSAETAFVSCKAMRMRTLADQGNKKAALVLRILDDKAKMLSAILIGNNLVNTFCASIAATIAYQFGGFAVSIATFLITVLILLFGEITPKTIATRQADKIVLIYARIIFLLMVILTPIIWLVSAFSNLFLGKEQPVVSITESELKTIVDVSHEEGVIESGEKQLIHNVFEFNDTKVKDVMVPRVHIAMGEDTMSYQDFLTLFKEEQFTRIPVYHDSIDTVIGWVNIKDLLLIDEKDFVLEKVLRKPFFTYENKPIASLLIQLRQSMNSMALVLDEYGQLAGLITLEDMIEELVGEVRDEYDSHEKDNILRIQSNLFDVKGYLSLHDVNEALQTNLDSEDYDSIGGLIIGQLGHFPKVGESVVLEDGTELRVVSILKNRIDQVRIKRAS